jgi:hypothetical protein
MKPGHPLTRGRLQKPAFRISARLMATAVFGAFSHRERDQRDIARPAAADQADFASNRESKSGAGMRNNQRSREDPACGALNARVIGR